MKKINRYSTHILDIGARFGLHPSWKSFVKDSFFYLVEADKKESMRLAKRYSKNNKIKIFNNYISSSNNKKVELYIKNNPSLSNASSNNNIFFSLLNWNNANNQNQIVEVQNIKSISLANFINKKIKRKIDFLKVDVKAGEYDILINSEEILKNIIGIRAEVHFNLLDHNYKNTSFNLLSKILIENKFTLINLDYLGKGDLYSHFINEDSRYGVLNGTDAVWIKDLNLIIKFFDEQQVLKAIVFLLLNNGIDIDIWVLDKTYKKFNSYQSAKHSYILNFIKFKITKHFNSLKFIPNQFVKKHSVFYKKIFNEKFLTLEKFNELELFNPIEM